MRTLIQNLTFLFAFLPLSILAQQEPCFECQGNTARGYKSSAFGLNNIVEGSYSSVFGTESSITGNCSFVAGKNTTCLKNYSSAIGSWSTSDGLHSFIVGSFSEATGICAFVFGNNSKAKADFSMSIGHNVQSSSGESFVIGLGKVDDLLINSIPKSLMVGFNSSKPTFFVSETPYGYQSGKIGIGNLTVPEAKLHIKADAVEDATLKLEPTGIGKTAKLLLGSDDYYLSVVPGNDLIFRTQTGKNFSFENGKIVALNLQVSSTSVFSGNVGIGITSPVEKLDVSGYAKTTSGYKVGSNIVISSSRDYSGRNGSFSGSVTTTGNTVVSGNVGIGTASPTEKLDVNGFAKTSSGYKVGTSQVIDVNRNFSGNNAVFGGTLNVTGIASFAGNVGIGNTSPQKKLDVAGDINFTGTLFQNGTPVNFQNPWMVNGDKIYYNNGNVGIGLSNPACLFEIYKGSINSSYSYINRIALQGDANATNNTKVFSVKNNNVEDIFLIYGDGRIHTQGGSLTFTQGEKGKILTGNGMPLEFGVGNQTRMYISGDGVVGIGTTNPSPDYKLSVAGKILAEELKIELVADWYDHVFCPDYPLMDLNELGEYIELNGHLPDIPNESEVRENGVNIGEMNALLLKKVEELTLYIIGQQKEIEFLKGVLQASAGKVER